MTRHRRRGGDEQALRLMRILGELDVWNDAHDGGSCWYRVVRASYRRGELSRAEWGAYRAAYAAAQRVPASDPDASVDAREPSRVPRVQEQGAA